jgi:hypothetical protein
LNLLSDLFRNGAIFGANQEVIDLLKDEDETMFWVMLELKARFMGWCGQIQVHPPECHKYACAIGVALQGVPEDCGELG